MPKRRLSLGGRVKADDQVKQSSSDTDDEDDLGFGNSVAAKRRRLINRNGSFNVHKIGVRLRDVNAYVYLVTLPWWKLFLVVLGAYVLFNLFFATIYVLIGVENLSGGKGLVTLSEQFSFAFFFSSQTFTTVGYGAISPIGVLANTVASFEAMTGLLGFAVATGVLWGRFSQPSAKIGFSKNIIIAPYKDINSLQLRIVNRRRNELIELEVQMTMMYYKVVDGVEKQEFMRLELERDKVALFPLTWTIVHPIDEKSPLYRMTDKDLAEKHVEFLVLIKAYDETFAQNVHLRMSYRHEEVLYGARFVKIFRENEGGYIKLEMDKISKCQRATLNKY